MKIPFRNSIGQLAAILFSDKRRRIAAGNAAPESFLERLINDSLIQKAAEEGDHQNLRSQLSSYWQGSAGHQFYEAYSDRFEENFLQDHYTIVEELKKVIAQKPTTTYRNFFELGCGDGQVINHMIEQLPGIEQFFGFDINTGIIERNQDFYSSDKLKFVAGDAISLIKRDVHPGSVVMTYGGVFEYFLEQELVELFNLLRQQSQVVIALVEPIYDRYDINRDVRSQAGGGESSFSHNYRHLLQNAGFEIEYLEQKDGEFRWLMIVAKSD